MAKNRSHIQRIAKLLGTTEEVFMQHYSGLPTRAEAESRINALARNLYANVFRWVNLRINCHIEAYSGNMVKLRAETEAS